MELEDRVSCLVEQLQTGVDDLTKQTLLSTKQELGIWEKWEEIRFYQIANNKWLKEGDQHSKLFHVLISTQMNKVTIVI